MARDSDPTLDTRPSRPLLVPRRTSPTGIPVPIVDDVRHRRPRDTEDEAPEIGDTSRKILAISETADEAAAKAEALDREIQPWRAGIRSAKRLAAGALSLASGVVLALVAYLRSISHDAGASEERARALEAEVRRLGSEVLYLRARLDGAPLPWYQPPRAADTSKGPPS